MQNHFRIGGGGGGGRREEKKCLQGGREPGPGCAANRSRCASHSPLLDTVACVCAEGCFSLLGDSRIFFQFFFFLSKGHCAQDALFLAACPWCKGRMLAAFGRAADSHCQSQ